MIALSSGCPLEPFLGCGLIGRAFHTSPSELLRRHFRAASNQTVRSFHLLVIHSNTILSEHQIGKGLVLGELFLSFTPANLLRCAAIDWSCVIQTGATPSSFSRITTAIGRSITPGPSSGCDRDCRGLSSRAPLFRPMRTVAEIASRHHRSRRIGNCTSDCTLLARV